MKYLIKLAVGALLCVALAQAAHAYVAILNKADHTELRIVPAPGKVTIDGDLTDGNVHPTGRFSDRP
jgi:hypothetical protein